MLEELSSERRAFGFSKRPDGVDESVVAEDRVKFEDSVECA